MIINVVVISAIPLALWFMFSALIWAFREEDKGCSFYKGRITTNYNAIAFIYNTREYLPILFKKLKPKTKVERDIQSELKKIAKEEREIESMEELEQLIHSRKALEKKRKSHCLKMYIEMNGKMIRKNITAIRVTK